MSYDLQVFGRRRLATADLRQLVEVAGLSVDDDAPTAATGFVVVRGARRTPCFTLGPAAAIEPEDVPEEITAVLLEPVVLYDISVEGWSDGNTAEAVRFARRLARAGDGAVLDPQDDGVWCRGRLRTVAPVPRGTIDIVEFRWYAPPARSGGAAAEAWLALARRHLPEALPRRFGTYEPLAGKLDVDGSAAFVQLVADEPSMVFFKATRPGLEGHLDGGADPSGVRSHSLSLHRDALDDPRWRDATRRLFTEFAVATGSFFASAEVVRGLEWSGRSVTYGREAERTTYLAPRGVWHGLLPYPVWWTWFGPEYAELVADSFPADRVTRVGAGLFHAHSDAPADRDQLSAPTPGTTAADDVPPARPGVRTPPARARASAPRTRRVAPTGAARAGRSRRPPTATCRHCPRPRASPGGSAAASPRPDPGGAGP